MATYILERKWHDTAVKTKNADGRVEVRMQVCLSPEVDLLLLPWAEYLKVLSPPELRDHFSEIAAKFGARHPKRGTVG